MNEVYFDPILGKPRDKDPQVIQSGGISGGSSSSSSAAPLITKDEGSTLTSTTASLNFVGSGVTATNSGNDVTITIPGGGSGGSVAWGDITGTLSNQTDLQSSLDAKQPLDSDLTTIAGLTATTNNFIVSVASAWASRTPSQVRTTLGLVIGTDVQAWDADLDTWATKTAPSGTVVGTSDLQTLTNKDLTSGTNTFPTFNQNTTGSAATLTTPRAIYGNNFDGSAALTQIIASTYGGTGNGFTKFTGPTTAEKTFTLPDSNATLLYSGGALGTPSSGTLTNATGLPISGLTSSTSTALGVGSIELGHASDTTIARVSAGVISVEGVTVDTISAANALTNKDLTSGTNTFPTFNQNTTGSAAKWTTARNLAGNSVDGSANVAFANKFIVQGTTDTGLSAAQFLGALGTGIVKNTTTTGVLSIAVAGDFPTLNQNTTGSAATLTTTRTLWGQNFDGSANVTGSLTSVGDITGGASNMTITSGTGASRTMILKTTTAGSAATTALTLGADQSATFAGHLVVEGVTSTGATGTGKFVFDSSPTIVTPTIASFTNAQHNHSNAAGGGTFAHANLTSLTADDHTQYALLAGRSGGQTLIGGTASGNSLTLQSTSNSTKGDILTVQQAGERFIVNGTSPPTANSYTKFAVAHANTYSAGETVIANDFRSLPTFDTTTNWSFTGADLTSIVTASQATTGSVIAVSFQAAAGNSGNTANVIGVNAYATGASGAGTIATAASIRVGHGGLAGTVTNQYGLLFSFQGFAGTVTNGYGITIPNGALGGSTLRVGLDIEQTTAATTNIGIRNAGATVFTPLVKTITAAGNSISVASTHAVTAVRLDNTSGGAITLTSTPTITAGQAGQILYIYNSSAQNVVFQRESALAGSKLRLGAASRTLNQYDTLTLIYDAQNGYWQELSFVDNT